MCPRNYKLFDDLRTKRNITLVTRCRRSMNKTPERREMIRAMKMLKHRRYLKERNYTVEPMQGVVKDIFDLDRCWMRGNENNRWLFAAMGLAVQMHQLAAYRNGLSTWEIKFEVLGHG